ncbi:hypothetical protein ACQ4PT_045363 [Festuca glaucescens]
MAPPSLPSGASFSPEDAELITVYLKRKIAGSPLPTATAHYIHDANVYAAEPAALVADLLAASAKNGVGSEEWYFFTPVKVKSSHDTRRCRTVAGGAGTWHSEKRRRDVLNGDEVVGYRQVFTFEPRNGWLMLEFSVVDRGDGGHRGEPIPIICKIYQTCRQSASRSLTSGSRKRKAAQGERSGSGSSESSTARVRRCLQFGSLPAVPDQIAVVASTSGHGQEFLETAEPQEEQAPSGAATATRFLVPFEQEAAQSQYSEFADCLIPRSSLTSYGTTLLHPGQDWATSQIPQGNTAGLSFCDVTNNSLPSYNYNTTGLWSFPPSTLSSSGNTLLYPRHDTSSMGNGTSFLGCFDASSMYSWCSETYTPTTPMSTQAEWASHGSNTNPLSFLCI